MRAAVDLELLEALEAEHALKAKGSLDAYCRYIEIPGAPINDDEDCEEFYPDNVVPAEHHQLLNKALEKVERGEIKRLLVFMPPGSAKSTYGTVTFPTWYMGKNPRKNIISASYNSNLAKKFGRKCRQICRSEEYNEVFDSELSADNKAANDWSIDNGSAYMAGGILSGLTGNRADGAILDDPIRGRSDAESKTVRDKTWEAYIADLRTRLKPSGWIVMIMTRWHEDDPAGRILPDGYNGESGYITAKDGEEWYVICLQAKCEREDDPLGREVGEYLWTDWFPVEHWEQEKASQGTRNWESLFQQRPSPQEGNIFKRPWVKRYENPPDPLEVIRIVQSWDTANKANELNDPAACTTWHETILGYYLIHVWKLRVEYPDLKKKACALYEQFKPHALLIEDKSSGQSLIQDLQRDTNYPVIPIEPVGDKVIRASGVSPLFEAGRVWLPTKAPWLADYESELFTFDQCVNDDQVDSTSQALSWMKASQSSGRVASGGRRRF